MKALHQPPASRPGSRKPRLARRLLLLALVLGTAPAVAQRARHKHGEPAPTPPVPAIADTVRQVVELPAATIDSLAVEPLIEPAVDSARLVWLQTPATLYEIVGDRMGCIETDAPHQFNAAVLAYVRLFTERQRSYTQRVLEREQFYFPIFEKYLAQYKLPVDLKYLSVVESALIPTAKSPVGAVGLWQFMPPTANDLRLKRDEWVDERMHPDKATEAACKHLRYLYGEFHDWELVLAAYNWGAGNMRRVMRRTGKKSFWDLYPHLPAETRNYVPTFTAIMYAMKYAAQHNLNDPALRYQAYEPLDTLGVRGQALDLRRLSRALGYEDSLAMSRYNPEVRHSSLPAGYRPYVLRFPAAAREHLSEVDRATLLAYCEPLSELPQPLPPHMARLAGVAPWPTHDELATNSPRPENTEKAPRHRRVYYTVRRGQTVASIAEKFDVSPAQVRRWNELPKHTLALKPGRELVVLVTLPPAASPDASVVAALPVLVPRHAAAADSVSQALVAANLRYAREAQAAAQREVAQVQELLRVQKQQAARIAAQQKQAIFRAAAAEKAQQQAVALAARPETAAATEPIETDSIAPPTPVRHRNVRVVAASSPREVQEEAPSARATSIPPTPPTELYTVRAGDNLTKLARTHGVGVAQVQAWNQLSTEAVAAGQKLRFGGPVPDAVATRATPHAERESRPEPNLSTHIVQPGDTLYNISRRFKVSVQELRRLNHLKSDDVKLGQKLVVHT